MLISLSNCQNEPYQITHAFLNKLSWNLTYLLIMKMSDHMKFCTWEEALWNYLLMNFHLTYLTQDNVAMLCQIQNPYNIVSFSNYFIKCDYQKKILIYRAFQWSIFHTLMHSTCKTISKTIRKCRSLQHFFWNLYHTKKGKIRTYTVLYKKKTLLESW